MKGFHGRLILLACLLLSVLGVNGAAVSGNADLNLSPDEISKLTGKAAKGDGDAAWRLYLCYSMARLDERKANLWLCRAAQLENAQADRILADSIKQGHDAGVFGATGPEAVRNLLEKASRTNGPACYELAAAYGEGYFHPSDLSKARFYYARGAVLGDRMCWKKLSQYCHEGIGGNRDEASAYYWISLEARCVDPRSISGKETWELREEVAKRLSLAELKRQWRRIDQYISKVREGKVLAGDGPFGRGLYHPDQSDESQKLADEREARHRRQAELSGRE